MIFSSLEFLCVFLPIVFCLYCILPTLKVKNIWLMLVSLFFYAYGEPVYVLLMIASSLINYVMAREIAEKSKGKKAFLVLDIILNLGLLAIFKYTDFAIGTLNRLFSVQIPLANIALPVGISFFTFQALSYVIDVYWGRAEAQKNYGNVLLYISFFPQLIAGPIVKYSDINEAISRRTMDADEIARGLRRFLCGLGKKVLIANTAGLVADHVFEASHSQVSFAAAWLGAIAYMIQIYYDFSGYSDMAIGLGHMFGFHFKENFQYPYGAFSIREFWRRWHISLSTWFREYLYIPLGGNRKGKARTCLNKLIVFFLTGLWHGASWTFVIWGLWHGFFLLLETFFPVIQKLPKWIGRIYTLLVVCVGFVMFRAETFADGLFMIGQMFTGFSVSAEQLSFVMQQLTPWFIAMMLAGMIGAAPIRGLTDRIRDRVSGDSPAGKWLAVNRLLYGGAFLLLAWCMIRLSGSTYNPFIYFRF